MPWSLQQRDSQWCVVKQGETKPVPGGCHSSRADAIKHQRALYANESRMASIYAELDALPEPVAEAKPVVEPEKSELVKIVVGHDTDVLTASMMSHLESISERQNATEQALVAALQAIGQREPVVNVHPAAVTVEPAQVTVESPSVTVEPAQVNVPPAQVTVNPPDVNVTVEAPAPVQKTVTFERDPLTQQVTRAEVTES